MTTVLVPINLQDDYFPGGTMELVGAKDPTDQFELSCFDISF